MPLASKAPTNVLRAGQLKRSFRWNLSGRVLGEVARTFKLLILAKILGPGDFAQFGVALLLVGVLEILTETGFEASLIRRTAVDPEHLHAVFTVQLLRGALLFCAVFAIAPVVAAFFHVPDAIGILRFTAVAFLIRGAANPGIVHLHHAQRFDVLMRLTTAEAIVSLVVSVGVALFDRTGWALAWGYVAGVTTRVALGYYAAPERLRLRIDQHRISELRKTGRWVGFGNIATYIGLQGDNATVGRVVGPEALGHYQLAFKISEIPMIYLSAALSQVCYPYLSHMHASDPATADASFRRYFGALLAVNTVCAAVMFILAPLGVSVLFDSRWEGVVPLIRILIVANLMRSVVSFGGWYFIARGQARSNFEMNTIRAAILVIAAIPFAHLWGAQGVAAAVVVASLGMLLFYVVRVRAFSSMQGRKVEANA